jgi:hypothetical protein
MSMRCDAPDAGRTPSDADWLLPMAVSDVEWLLPCAMIVAFEVALWFAAWRTGLVSAPLLVSFGSIALAFFAFVVGIRVALAIVSAFCAGEEQPSKLVWRLAVENRLRIICSVLGLPLLTFGMAAFSALKGGIPHAIPFWLDAVLAPVELPIWHAFHRLLGWTVPFFDHLYGTFVLTHAFAVFGVLVSKPSALKSRAMVTLCLSWAVLGIAAAYLLSSAGPLFYDRLYGSDRFAELDAMILAHAPLTKMTSDALWMSYTANLATVANGISAMPSMHVGCTLWLALVLKNTRAAPVAWLYYGLIWIGSVLLGWHYFSDGLVGSIGVLALWKVASSLIVDAHLMAPLMRRPLSELRHRLPSSTSEAA